MPDEAPDRVVLGKDTNGDVVSVEAHKSVSIRALCPRPGTTPKAEIMEPESNHGRYRIPGEMRDNVGFLVQDGNLS